LLTLIFFYLPSLSFMTELTVIGLSACAVNRF
jgi:hypothetical protein